jgi:hypothetical protein
MGEMPKPSNKYGEYDSDLQMFKETAVPDLKKLVYYRRLVEDGKTDSPRQGPPSGELAAMLRVDSDLGLFDT